MSTPIELVNGCVDITVMVASAAEKGEKMREILIAVVVLVACVAGGVAAVQGIFIGVGIPVTIKYSDQVIYQGNSACVTVQSAGAATRVNIRGGYMCLFPKKYYLSSDIVIES